ncbi:MAG: sugar phosphate isomerase/epimerase [Gemmatimonadetes bacterium]|nr:sugar phosphate isomerase/epimerase [Gemmatimonadota bacterium]MBT7858884.1 sugar phosphate isomerase/epimerase [Gemmatimonadota bacterium]
MRTCSVHCDGAFAVEDLSRMREAGFELAELSFNRPAHGVSFDDRQKAASFRRAAEELSMRLVSHAPDQYWLSNPDREELKETVAAVEDVLAGAGAYGVEAMVIHCCPGKALVQDRVSDQLDALVEALQTLAPACERAGVRLAAETMVPGRLTSSMEHLITAVDRVGSPWVGICLDTNHLNLSEDVDAAVRRAAHRLVEFHLNDNHFVKEEHLLPYEGEVDWVSLAEAIAAIDYAGFLIMEPGGQYVEEEGFLATAHQTATRFQDELMRAG